MLDWRPIFRLVGVVSSVAATATAVTFVVVNSNDLKILLRKNALQVEASWTTNYTPSIKWDCNWDKRDPASLVEPPGSKTDIRLYEEELKRHSPTAVRHLFLIRHGHYDTRPDEDRLNILTPLGEEQVHFTGKRLQELAIPFTKIIASTMSRAEQTAKIVQKFFPQLPIENTDLLREGSPIPPEPPNGRWKPQWQFLTDGPRIEAAFQKHFHRASVGQKEDSFEILVCHANVIRYFICRALQFPPEAWLRFRLYHASITWVTIRPDGRVCLKMFGDSGHIPQNKLSHNTLYNSII